RATRIPLRDRAKVPRGWQSLQRDLHAQQGPQAARRRRADGSHEPRPGLDPATSPGCTGRRAAGRSASRLAPAPADALVAAVTQRLAADFDADFDFDSDSDSDQARDDLSVGG